MRQHHHTGYAQPDCALVIRRFAWRDRFAVLEVFRSNQPDFFARSERRAFVETMKSPDGPLFVVLADQRIVAFGGYELSQFYNHAVLVFGQVHRAFHGRGLGRLLLYHRILHSARHPKLKPAYMLVDTTPQTAGFFDRCGFVRRGAYPGGYRLIGFDKIDLSFHMTDEALADVGKRLNQTRDALTGAAQREMTA